MHILEKDAKARVAQQKLEQAPVLEPGIVWPSSSTRLLLCDLVCLLKTVCRLLLIAATHSILDVHIKPRLMPIPKCS